MLLARTLTKFELLVFVKKLSKDIFLLKDILAKWIQSISKTMLKFGLV